jgi:hypothetical protein
MLREARTGSQINQLTPQQKTLAKESSSHHVFFSGCLPRHFVSLSFACMKFFTCVFLQRLITSISNWTFYLLRLNSTHTRIFSGTERERFQPDRSFVG